MFFLEFTHEKTRAPRRRGGDDGRLGRWSHVACAIVVAAGVGRPALAAPTSAQSPDQPKPYLDAGLLPDGAAMLLPPPPYGSAALLLDQQVFLRSRALKQQDPGRWALATSDAQLDDDHLLGGFACALDIVPDRVATPDLYRLLDRAARDMGSQTGAAREHFARARPYLRNHQPICVARFTSLDHSPSYPSGDATLGMGIALILAELAPDRAGALLARGRAFGESRIVCGVHWLSDVQAGYLDAAALVATLHSSASFRADLDRARGELDAARERATMHPDTAACTAEHDAAAHSLLFQPQP